MQLVAYYYDDRIFLKMPLTPTDFSIATFTQQIFQSRNLYLFIKKSMEDKVLFTADDYYCIKPYKK